MDEQQFKRLKQHVAQTRTVSLNDLMDTTARTLLLGLGASGATHHVYIDPKDGQIHVLRYVSAGHGAEECALIVSHTQGPNGGVERNTDFLPSKWLYPESCDMEFCLLLRSHDVSLPFAQFDAEGRARVDQFNGFAGHLAAGLPHAVELAPRVPASSEDFGDAQVMQHLLREACAGVGVRHVVWTNRFLVAESDVPAVLAQVESLCASMSPAVRMSPGDLLKALCAQALWTSDENCADDYTLEADGSYVFDIDFFEGAMFRDNVPGALRYEGENAGEDVSAMLAMYEGRPYLVAYEWRDWGGIQGKVHVNLFGSPDKFIAELVQRYKLVPDTDA